MALIKLNRINKGGEIIVNSSHILFVEIEAKVTTVHMTHNLLFSVVEQPEYILEQIESSNRDRKAP